MAAKIKICGITNLADAQLAVQLGADFLGFNFYPPSPRYLEPEQARAIIDLLPPRIITVGVFVNEPVAAIKKVLARCPLQMAQLHGDETSHQCLQVAQLGVKVIKALRIRRPADIEQANQFDLDMILLDAFYPQLYGGTGQAFDWSWIRPTGDKKIFLAGGISPENITQALAAGTYAVDLCSGIEKTPGRKDADKMRSLFAKIADYYHYHAGD